MFARTSPGPNEKACTARRPNHVIAASSPSPLTSAEGDRGTRRRPLKNVGYKVIARSRLESLGDYQSSTEQTRGRLAATPSLKGPEMSVSTITTVSIPDGKDEDL